MFALAWTRVGRLSLEGARSAALQERANGLEYAQASQVSQEPLPKSISAGCTDSVGRQPIGCTAPYAIDTHPLCVGLGKA